LDYGKYRFLLRRLLSFQGGLKGGRMEEIYELHADFCKIFSNAKRLEIINSLKDKEMSASELIERIGLSKANLSQHMGVLKSKGVILTRREGVNIYYRISNPKIIQACHLIREVLFEQFKEKGKMVSSLRPIK
jgi:ArsR family transcriptional regulator